MGGTRPLGFEEAVRHTTEAFKQQSFGIISEIDVKQTLKSKIGVDFRNYRILGACNPKLAHEALKFEDKIGTMLPCNVVVQEVGSNSTEIRSPQWRRSTIRASRRRRIVFRRF